MTLALHDPNRGSVKVGSYASQTETDNSSLETIDVPHLIRRDPTGKRLAFFDDKSSRIELRSDSRGISIAVEGIPDKVHQFRWLKNARGFVVTTHNNAYVGFLTSESPKTVTFKPLLPNSGKAVTTVRTIATGVVVTRNGRLGVKVFSIPIDGLRTLAPQRVASKNKVDESSVLAGSRIVIRVDKFGATDRLLTFSTEEGKPRLIDTTPVPKRSYIKNWATGSKTLAYVADQKNLTLFVHADKLVKVRLPKGFWPAPILWANKVGSRYLIGSNYQLGLWNQNGKLLWTWSPPEDRVLTSASFAPDESIIASAGLRIYRVKDGKAKVLLRVKGRHPERLERNAGWKAYSFVDHPILMDSGKIGYSLVHVDKMNYY
ncbi:MAG: hypothetical protein JKY56_25205 [Kofleriaceae bacterium]|nr:hypothetical protein [Kofleriaceae bacterium]